MIEYTYGGGLAEAGDPALARKGEYTDGGEYYQVRVYTSTNKLVNKFDVNEHSFAISRTVVDSPYKWISAKQHVFEAYMEFLKTNIKSHLERAERNRLDG